MSEIKHCPSCKGDLKKHKDHAQGIRFCLSCGEVWYILNTGKIKQ